ncbi:MAG: M16 family metallopeptidase [Saprospiraceae bacterium]
MKLIKFFSFLLLGVFLFSAVGCKSDAAKEASTPELKIDYEKYTLDNGLEVILHEDKSDPIISLAILFHVGSNREKPGRTGFAHFFEHMLFQNSENVGKGNFFKKIEEMGGTLNGGTWNDGTVYYEVVPKDALERVLWMESDRMGFMINTVTTPVLENEKQVVKNEKRQRVDNQPYGHTNYVLDKALYPEDHPYNWQVIGSLEDLQNATIEDVKEFYDKWYGPNNATLVLAGDFENASAKEMIEKYFGEIPAKEAVEAIKPRPAVIAETVKLMHEDNFAELPELRLVWPTVEDGHVDGYALDYLGQLLSQGKRAPFYKEIVEKEKLAPSTSSYNSGREIAGNFYISIRANNGVDLDQVHAGVETSFANFEKNGIDDKDMERIKNSLETDFYGGISGVLSKSFQLAQFNEFRGGDPGGITDEIKKIQAVTKADVMRVYEKYIKGKNFIATSFVPKGKVELALEGATVAEVVEEPIVQGAEADPMEEGTVEFEKTPSKFDRSIEPALGKTPSLATPDIYQSKLANGLNVYGIQNNELPLVEFSLRIKGGMLLDDMNKVGVANLITDVMKEGTKNKTPEELQDAIGQLGASINMYTSSEFISISGSCLARNYDKVLAIFEEMLLEPRWDEKEFARLKKSTLTTIQQRNAQPNRVASNVFNKLIYGKGHILSNNSLGAPEVVESITMEDLKAYYEKNFSPSISSFHIVGAVSKDKVMSSLKSLEDKWKAKDVSFPTYAEPTAVDKPVVYFVDVPEAKQSVIQIGNPTMKGNDPDYNVARLVNHRLGGSFNSKLNQTLREEKGYTYGARSFLPRRVNTGYFGANSSVRSNVTKESIDIFKDIITDYKEGYTKEDLEATKSIFIKKNARAFETLYQKMGVLENISTLGLPTNYIEQEEKDILNLNIDNAKGLIDKYINPDKMIYLIVGDAKTQYERVKKSGLGTPIKVDKDGTILEAVPN